MSSSPPEKNRPRAYVASLTLALSPALTLTFTLALTLALTLAACNDTAEADETGHTDAYDASDDIIDIDSLVCCAVCSTSHETTSRRDPKNPGGGRRDGRDRYDPLGVSPSGSWVRRHGRPV